MAQAKIHFDDLPDDMIIEIFSRLPTNKLLSTETVSRTWKRCVDKTLNRVEVVSFGKPYEWEFDVKRCQHLRSAKSQRTLSLFSDPELVRLQWCGFGLRISAVQVDSMTPLLKRCPEAKCLTMDQHVVFEDIDAFKRLMNALPKVECLFFDWFDIKEFDDTKWQLFCQEIGSRIKHLIFTRLPERINQIDTLLRASTNLQFVSLRGLFAKIKHYIEALRNRPSIELTITFTGPYPHEPVDVDTAAVISRAKHLTIEYECLHSIARHYPTFARLNRLEVDLFSRDIVENDVILTFPALEHLVWVFHHPDNYDREVLNSPTIINHLTVFNLPGLKSLALESGANEKILTALAGKLTSLKKMFSKYDLPTDSLLLLKQINDLRVEHSFARLNDLPKILRFLEVVAQMKQLRRCRIKITSPFQFNLKSLSKDDFKLVDQLTRAQADLRQALQFVEIDFPLIKGDFDDEKKLYILSYHTNYSSSYDSDESSSGYYYSSDDTESSV